MAFFQRIRYVLFLLPLWLLPSTSQAEDGILSGITSWLLTYINKIIAVINKLISDIWITVIKFFKQFMLTILDMLKDFFIWIFEAVFDLIIYIINGLGTLLDSIDIMTLVSGLPESVTNIMGLIGLGHCLTVIGIAISIRILLQLIPFTRLGS